MTAPSGPQLFARYAYAPNALGYCGPAEGLADRTDAEIRVLARHFTGAWPYLRVLSALTGIADPLDPRLVESYWLGGGLGSGVAPAKFLAELLAIIAPIVGGYWEHLTPALATEAAPDHNFHVFGIYPWTHLLGRVPADQPIRILDSCRITPARVCARDSRTLTVCGKRLGWTGDRLTLSAEDVWTVSVTPGTAVVAADIACGDQVALHWDHVCGRLDADAVDRLTAGTARQLKATNARLTHR
ncbi:DUF6390 family protein [Nocardia stercoris]|uniref:Uncharacterized protein n=1 Tax=Nocardia stercoris TaxID=2483361 RepID=A0A3M2KSF3_9NOCA|nr:DUF6390 family protein [Nocardia stercoris]RMI28587.1 hypothetical protein EBN03_29710 [Nocardia stercoris]